ncbi:HAD family hydrolase [Streptomonospora nanhaiensis]|uniref:Putative hydrolase of the HAD superfamily n=1 Tax=Streptomonospora nanhaiensis TaxID=1323731 RepID=A0A853BHC6_9ACTN|nr:HAD family hydrolase [Streptomonospora nanhaiensis]MBV2366302.1 HAD family hydrolase [Streptomonospora nanhaiensis]MBX9387917.1 HAD family hydrolase [Streptomonospora nanhaiensis]NYI94430.1 putative hydrolase of the HAD superfamily [Streptomonospora nanhaiensis]
MPATAPAPEAIFFDLDDTLLDDRAASSAGLRTLMELLGHPDFGAARRLWDVQTDISFGAYIAGRLTLAEQRRERVRALAVQAGHAHIADAHCDDLYQRYLAAHRAAWTPFRDVAPVLNDLAGNGVRLAVVTNGIEQLQTDKLARLGIAEYFGAVVCADSVGAGKPDPRIFHIACQRVGVPPERAWHVGDQLRADALGAIAAGLHPILIDRHERGEAAAHHDITVVTGLDEVRNLARAAHTAAARPAGPVL